MHYFVDWLTLAQQHPIGSIPDVGAGAFLVVDQDGEVERRSLRWVQAMESHETSIAVRCQDGLVEVSGNPSRWGRADNVFGVSWDQALGIFNQVVASFGLPAFTYSDASARARAGALNQSRLAVPVADGAVVRRVDLARNFETGLDGAGMRSFLDVLAQGNWQGKKGRMQEWSDSWGSRRHSYAKVYAKGPELRAHDRKAGKAWDLERVEYRQRLAAWAESVGLLRWEVQFGRDGLRRRGCRSLGSIENRLGDLAKEAEDMRVKIWPTGLRTGLESVAEQLQAEGVSPRQAAFLQALAHEWAAGVDVFSQFKVPTAYRYRAALLPLGVDIRHPPVNVAQLRARVRVIECRPAEVPAWYRQAA